jgi:acyl-homoserine lactone acylase PvdQ
VEILATHLGTDLALLLKDDPATLLAIEDAILREHAGEAPVLLDDLRTPEREGLAGFLARAAPLALDKLADEDSSSPYDWRWGRVHTLAFKSPLAELPVVGNVFQTTPSAEAGWRTTVRAESGIPVRAGAVFRMSVVVGEKPSGRMILDLGQSGHVGHPNAVDMRGDWATGTLRPMPIAKDKIPVRARLILEPRKSTEGQETVRAR